MQRRLEPSVKPALQAPRLPASSQSLRASSVEKRRAGGPTAAAILLWARREAGIPRELLGSSLVTAARYPDGYPPNALTTISTIDVHKKC